MPDCYKLPATPNGGVRNACGNGNRLSGFVAGEDVAGLQIDDDAREPDHWFLCRSRAHCPGGDGTAARTLTSQDVRVRANEVPVRVNYVGGEFVTTTRRFEKTSPIDGSRVARVCEADGVLVDRSVAAARRAVRGEWQRISTVDRTALLHRIADGIEHRFDDFVAAEVADTGKPLAQARSLDVPRGAANFRLFADLVRNVPTECFQTDTPDGAGALNYALRRPVGVVAAIVPWNLPLLLLTWKTAPALAAGNAVIAKPSEETPSTATLLAEVVHEAGVPPGVFNVVHGFGPGSAGELLTTHADVDAITFTGETTTGSAIMRAAAPHVKVVSFELGGKNAAIVFADADFERTVEGVARAVFSNCGQVCLCAERIYVQRPLFAAFVDALAQKARSLRIGDPLAEDTEMGPLISRQHREKVLSYYALAREEGGRIVTGGGVPALDARLDGGAWIEPTIVTGLAESARCVTEEIFGPVCHVAPFDSPAEAVELANDSRYGLAASVWTRDLATAHDVARRLEVGIVWINSWFLRDLRTPFGGVKLSGIGREGGVHSLGFFTELTNVCVKL
jgi:aminomuconate-semialdehyde/2-hydroxymuconate-6-semialdehyde dehydrogenase